MTDSTTVVRSPDGTPIAVHASGPDDVPPLVLVHGTAGDHTTFRVIGPRLALTRRIHAIDRRGRAMSGDTAPYAITREFEDVVAVAEAIRRETGAAVDVFGHSYGGRCALGAALRTDAIRRVVCYEGAPTPSGASYHPAGLDDDLRALLAAGDGEALLARFMTGVVGMSPAELDAYRANPVWPARVAAAPTIVRELGAERDPEASLEALGAVRQPVLQLLGGASLPVFGTATRALDAHLADGRVVVIDGARHAAHHTHPDAVIAAVSALLADETSGVRD